ncbi:cation-translocating P-type ATPase [Olivibacter sitiensis]|uniref:cation-translocating P-type ATPase n=1 Tax=Olivibacter sitiensis TaxID=376470 RepID=UPI00040DE25F|nr:cation-translocating P-type ATPase [Olivibacter sitiensis]
MKGKWYTIATDQLLEQLHSRPEGLSEKEASEKLASVGKNELTAKKREHPIFIFLRQFTDVMIWVLAAAAAISMYIGEMTDGYVILFILLLNAIIGFVQEYRAEQAMNALRQMASPTAQLLREGKNLQVPATEIVPGDVVILEAGNMIAADMRLLESESLQIDESSLTGESNAIDKNTHDLTEENLPLGDQVNMAFKGTMITNGRGKGLVVATGMDTELGHIADMLDDAKSSTPLQLRLSQFSRKLTLIVLILCGVLFGVGYLRGEEFSVILLTSISLAVAAIPEALPAVVTISLALGARRLAKQHVLIRKLYAVEALGSVTYICTDKTGTLTKNSMTVKTTWTPDESDDQLLKIAMRLNNDAQESEGKLTGDPTEIALLDYTEEDDIEALPRVGEIPFDSDRKAMTTIHEKDGKYMIFTKGACESITEICNAKYDKDKITAQNEEMAAQGMRVLAFAYTEWDELPKEIKVDTVEKNLTFLGLVGMIDPPREEAKTAIAECKSAGIIPVMITGDHPLTAKAIARELKIIDSDDELVVTGKQLQEEGMEFLQQEVEKIRVYARVSPEQKFNIVDVLQQKKQFVSMTGDGVNDAPSLKKANIGIAMGITGTDVSKEASSMILLDDNFATIVKAVREGRRIYDNIRKFIKYILTGNTAEIWTIFLAPFLGLPIPLQPIHILWVNLITDGLPALALASESAEKGIMQRPPRKTDESIFAGGLGKHVIWMGIFIAAATLTTQWFTVNTDKHWQTMVFTVLCLSQLFHAIAIRSERQSLWQIGILSNKPMLWAFLATLLLQLAVIYLPFMNTIFHTQPLTLAELGIATAVASLNFFVVELYKYFKRRKAKKQ